MHAAAAYAQLDYYATLLIPDETVTKCHASSHRFPTFHKKRCLGICSSILETVDVSSSTAQRIGELVASD